MTPGPAADPDFPRLKEHVIRVTGLAYYADKDADLTARLGARMSARGAADCGAYLRALTDGPDAGAELDALITDLTIGETFFFRHREAFAALRDVVLPGPDRPEPGPPAAADLERRVLHRGRAVLARRSCSAASSPRRRRLGGERRRAPTSTASSWPAPAAGRFEEWAFRAVPADVRAKCFTPAGAGWQIAPRVPGRRLVPVPQPRRRTRSRRCSTTSSTST